jgi:hypothetical protein
MLAALVNSGELCLAAQTGRVSTLIRREASADTNLLAFSAEPVDVNPGYHLAHDFAAFLARQQGVNRLLDSLVRSGIRSLLEFWMLVGLLKTGRCLVRRGSVATSP